jgi:hypothetical protein
MAPSPLVILLGTIWADFSGGVSGKGAVDRPGSDKVR